MSKGVNTRIKPELEASDAHLSTRNTAPTLHKGVTLSDEPHATMASFCFAATAILPAATAAAAAAAVHCLLLLLLLELSQRLGHRACVILYQHP